MGVTGLWTVVQPCARPIKLETLNKKRLAVDASIWIYQFLKAVRDKEGNALRNSHVVGFFRRICKLLFFGIKPVFVFDGGAPILKRQTVSGRKARREGRREDAIRTAGKLLAVQMQRRAEDDDRKRREERDRPPVGQEEEEEVPENLVYVDELQMTEKERQQNRTFKKKDAYHLPNLDVDLADMGAPNDPRIMSHEELEEYARQFHTGEDVNIYDFNKIDFNSPFFLSLPASDRYNILNAARLRSRLRMGYSKEQLDTMFPDRMAFSRFQIDRVKERNELTQRLMNLNGMNGEEAMFGMNNGGRVAGEKGKEYVLVKNDGVEGGWALGVVSNKGEGERSKPIDVEGLGKEGESTEEDEDWEDDGFEDVPIEGLNRLPRRPNRPADVSHDDASFESDAIKKRRRALYEGRKEAAGVERAAADPDLAEEDLDSLFVPQQNNGHGKDDDEDIDDLFEDVVPLAEDEDEDLNRAIAMSLEHPENDSADDLDMQSFSNSAVAGPRIDQPLEFNRKNAKAGRDFAHLANARAYGSAPKPFEDESDEENDLDLHPRLAESRPTKDKPQGGPRVFGLKEVDKMSGDPREPASSQAALATPSAPSPTPVSSSLSAGFDGPLPFESLNLGTSILGRKKNPAVEPAGGFEKEHVKEKPAQPLPPWFSGDIREATAAQKAIEEKQHEAGNAHRRSLVPHRASVLKRQETGEVIDLEARREKIDEIVNIESSDEGDEDDVIMEDLRPFDPEVRMGDLADLSRAEPPRPDSPPSEHNAGKDERQETSAGNEKAIEDDLDSEELVDWSESEPEEETRVPPNRLEDQDPAGGKLQEQPESPPKLENVGFTGLPKLPQDSDAFVDSEVQSPPSLPRGQSSAGPGLDDLAAEDEDIYSDPEEEDLMRQLAIEAEEHARFASTLNSKSQLQNAEDYEKELRQLRNQQKKDRRDADEVTHIMVTECQQLLKLFGLPYVTAPMEAEAQCAELVNLGIVDGIVTDDSDVFLFGGTRVYKNMFNQAKFVECYLSSDLEKEYSLDRQKLIRIAHLLGSDYTEGLPNVGPVTALEILSEFETLEHFSEWWGTVQMGQKLSAEDAANPFRRKFRKNASKLFLPAVFPDLRVDQAYLHPEVDKDPSPFQWGVPDLDALRSFLMATIGWSQERTDEVLVPVIKDMNRRENEGTQANITQFFGGGVGAGGKPNSGSSSAFAPRRRLDGKSKRMETALGRLQQQARNRTIGEGEANAEADAEPAAVGNGAVTGLADAAAEPRGTSQRKSKKRPAPVAAPGSDSDSDDGHDEYEAPKKSRKRGQACAKGSTTGRKKGNAQR